VIRLTTAALVLLVGACGADSSNNDQPEPAATEAAVEDLKERQAETLNAAAVNSLARQWNISTEAAACLLENLRASQLAGVAANPEVKAEFDRCGVDPAVVD
jgi:hypothetical protein